MRVKMFCIYLLERSDGLKYVGQTINFDKRLKEHDNSLRFSEFKIKSYKILDTAKDIEESLEKEKKWIHHYDTHKNGLNITLNGSGYKHKNVCNDFNTLGMSYTKNSRWFNDGNKEIRINDGDIIPEGFSRGRVFRKRKPHSEETRRKMSADRTGKARTTKLSEKEVLDLFNLYKSRPHIEGVGTRVSASKSFVLTYERAFSKKYAKKFDMTPNGVFNILKNKGGIAWKKQWLQVFGENNEDFFVNKRNRLVLDEEQVEKIFRFISENKLSGKHSLKHILKSCAVKHSIPQRHLQKLYYRKGGKRWRYIWNKFNLSDDNFYIVNAKITEDKVSIFYSEFFKSGKTKKDFYRESLKYGISVDKGRKLLYSENTRKWKHIWEKCSDEHRNTN